MSAAFDRAIREILAERTRQDVRWGTIEQNPHRIHQWLALIREEWDEAFLSADQDALQEVVQIAALCVACLEQHMPLKEQRSGSMRISA